MNSTVNNSTRNGEDISIEEGGGMWVDYEEECAFTDRLHVALVWFNRMGVV